MILLVVILQVASIFWLEDQPKPKKSTAAEAPILRLANHSSELLTLNDPSLVALPQQHGFSGPAWMRLPQLPAPSFEWRPPIQWLEPRFDDAGKLFTAFMRTNEFAADAAPGSQSELLPAECISLAARARSTWRVEGEIAARRLLTAMDLPSWPAVEILTNSVVQLLIDSAGKPVSLALLPPGSGSPEADQRALELARAARFQPSSGRPLSWGSLIFEWNTVAK
jgi:hypothetical protein